MSQAPVTPLHTPIPVWFQLPEGFIEIPLVENPQLRAQRMGEMLEATFPAAPLDEKLTLVAASELLMQGLLDAGAIHASSFLYRLGDGDVCSGTAIVFMEDKNVRPLEIFAERTLYSASAEYTDVPLDKGELNLPCGTAVLIARDVAGTSLASIVQPTEGGAAEVNRQLEVYIPFPHGFSLLKVCFATPDLGAWEELLPAFGKFLTGIAFTPPGRPRTGQNVDRMCAADDWAQQEFG
ncbi:hypothetical protein HCC61_09540 [Streptomyces sp. HNM0575]|uniref:hypothetical protein n=1 Tax=Streptomyces sp. HNM0575 TaxID=2716338 RepID=UPI00145EAEED|nr:hypothetical protein [Streptomyces sp. HNM0575]NLU72915.1 hypothetical protein [Streptomyces sp. HNM0575]